jgi:hypothetical protein
MTPSPTSRDDLPFVGRDAHGERLAWQPRRHPDSPDAGWAAGLAHAQALAALALSDEHAAYAALMAALLAPAWNGQAAEEAGFADGLARAAAVGWRAQACRTPLPFATQFDPLHAEYCALHTRVALMEAQLKALQQTPWRSWDEAEEGQE